ncbi:ADP-ribosyl cyclase/cyclic ADP-ribose hydrolase 1-like [Betta splendens]|uniref:ADP-ribosyl cyclase/cyclic ADP-ribose hydrolase n=1 Tax=Betta splendens TaxID=158456 RepID=A0A6P7MEP1_BETSP|nr:ADP-ribosyl cyclase/cyclic ADP-ribose hydrolase 1-like [Betta splendens]
MKLTWIAVIVGAVVVVIIVLGVSLGLTVGKKKDFKSTFIDRCETFKRSDCKNIWKTFSKAYVRRNNCTVRMEDYNKLMDAAPLEPLCNKALFWSDTKDFARSIAAKTDNKTLEKTLLGHTLDGLTWCGKEGSDETFTSGCPSWGKDDCENNPVRSFWKRASAAFADAACGDVTALLNGDSDTPFSPTSIFGSIEIKRLKYPRVKSMKVVLVSKKKPKADCSHPSLVDLQNALDAGINYSCRSNGHKFSASVIVYLLLMGHFSL